MIRTISGIVLAATLFVGCGEEEAEDVGVVNGNFPRVHAIPLDGMFATSAALSENECDTTGMNGIFGLPLGGACHTAPMASNLLVGDTSPDFECAQYDPDSDAEYGLLIHLICAPWMQAKTQSMLFSETGDSGEEWIAISFEQFGDDEAVGYWNRGGEGSYPADIRVWMGDAADDLTGVMAIHLESQDKGTVYLDRFGEEDWDMQFDFNNPSDVSSCATTPSSENCFYNKIQIYAGEGAIADGPPNGFNLSVFADSKTTPNFTALEGKYRYTAEYAAASFTDDFAQQASLEDVRNIYFQTIKQENQIWGSFAFKDENDDSLTYSLGDADLFDILAEGRCSNIGDSDENFDECTTITPADYTSFWQGEDDVESIEEKMFDVSFDGAPTTEGIVLAP
jgi:hypothetical protein